MAVDPDHARRDVLMTMEPPSRFVDPGANPP